MTDQTVRVAARARGELKADDASRIFQAHNAVKHAQLELEQAIVESLKNGASVRVIADATGIAGSTIQRYVNRHK